MIIKKYAFFLILLTGLVVSGCTKKETNVEIQPKQNQAQIEEMFEGSLQDLLGLGRKVECSWTYQDEEEGVQMSGTVWVDGQRSRTETQTKVGEMMVKMNMLTSEQTMYMWEEGKNEGFEYDLASLENTEENKTDDDSQSIDKSLLEKYQYKCKAWAGDEAKFSVPTEVIFVDMAKQIEQVQDQTKNLQESLSGVCNSLPEPQKSECLESMQ